MPSLLYRCITPNVEVKEYGVAASQYFYHDGGHFVYLDGNGNVVLGLSATATLKGWAITPKGMGAGTVDTYWLSSAVTAADKVRVITDPRAKFVVPASTTVTAGQKGDTADMVGVNDGTQQYALTSASTLDVLIIDDLGTYVEGGAATDAVVHINPAKYQADS